MRKRIFGICDTDKSYISAFCSYLNRREAGRFTVMAFSEPEMLESYLYDGRFDLLVVSESFIEASAGSTGDAALPEGATFILAEEKEPCDYMYPAIYKYQSAERIISQVLSAFSGNDVSSRRSGRVRIIGVYSPLGRCGKTSLALAAASRLALRQPTLLISLDDLPGHDELLRHEDNCGLSDLLYRFSACGELDTGMLPESDGGAVVIACADCPEDIRQTDPMLISGLIEALRDLGVYRNIVVDAGCALPDPSAVLKMCREIWMPLPDDAISSAKADAWRMRTKHCTDETVEKIRKIGLWPEGSEAAIAAKLLGME
ncbi:MAG: hypothetical protein IJS22_09190 [Lachnospiraceae bacterium]|nr:hypothetical protein [Lachnospiraceae bacterium]